MMKMMPVLPIYSLIFGQMGMGIDGFPPHPPFRQNFRVYTKTVHYFAGDLTSYSENIVWRSLKTISEITHFRKKSPLFLRFWAVFTEPSY